MLADAIYSSPEGLWKTRRLISRGELGACWPFKEVKNLKHLFSLQWFRWKGPEAPGVPFHSMQSETWTCATRWQKKRELENQSQVLSSLSRRCDFILAGVS